MKPSSCSTSSTRARNLEAGLFTFAVPRSWPLRMRARRSPIGSVIAISSPLPAGLGHTGDLPPVAQLAQRNARQFRLAVITLRPARHLAAMMDACLGRVARQLRELEACRKALLRRQRHVFGDRLQRFPFGRVLRHHLLPLGIPVDLTLLRHSYSP